MSIIKRMLISQPIINVVDGIGEMVTCHVQMSLVYDAIQSLIINFDDMDGLDNFKNSAIDRGIICDIEAGIWQ